MSMGPLGSVGGVAGSQLPQAKGTDADLAAKETADQKRANESGARASSAEGIGETSEQQETGDRDADGRRIWEVTESAEAAEDESEPSQEAAPSRDATGQRGNRLDLSG